MPELPHPVGLVLELGDRLDELVREAAAGLEEVVLASSESEKPYWYSERMPLTTSVSVALMPPPRSSFGMKAS